MGRPFVSSHASTRDGKELRSSGVPEDKGVRVRTPNRSVCNISKQQSSRVLCTATREHGAGHGCDVTFVGRPVGVRLPANRLHKGGTSQNATVKVRTTTSSSSMAKAAMVPPIAVPAGRRATLVAGQGQATEAARHDILPPEARNAPASRVEVIKRSYEEAGFPEQVSTHLARRNKQSTNTVYEAKWRVYSRWCLGRSFDPCSPTLNQVLEFFCHLFDALHLAPASIEGYRSMLSPILSQTVGLELSRSKVVTDLMASFRAQRPRLPPVMPDWDITFVLYSLSKEPYEPIEKISIQLLTFKTFFLVLLASGRRRSDIHALDISRVEFDRNDGSVILYPSRSFLPKTKAATEGSAAFSPIRIQSLKAFVGNNEPDSCLCPVRAIREYISRTREFRKGRNRLFISVQPNRSTDISPQTMSIWVKSLIQQVYKTADIDALRLYKVSAHQVRHISMSLASAYNVGLETIVRSGMWTNPSTFTNFYLSGASTSVLQAERFRLGPLIIAQSVIHTS